MQPCRSKIRRMRKTLRCLRFTGEPGLLEVQEKDEKMKRVNFI